MLEASQLIYIYTQVFSTEVFIGLVLLIVADLFRRKQAREAVWLVVATAGMAIVVITLKEYFAVPRPDEALVALDSYAFPSGHSTSVTFLAVVLGWYIRRVWSVSYRLLLPALAALCLIVGYSRLYLQVHTLEQVLVGIALGLLIGAAFLWRVRSKKDQI
jgi:undecaprenyl-diphosphatase